ncbi:MAG: hypothetical protein ACYDB7_11780 [Mycobacteriales bacterium]
MAGQARSLGIDLADRTAGFGFLISDRDRRLTAALDGVFTGAGVRAIRTLVPAPRATAVTEPFVGTVPRERLDQLLITQGRHLRSVPAGLAEHYNGRQSH